MSEQPTTGRRRERGAILVLTAAFLATLLVFASLAVDLGYQRVARRDMQALADVVALDLIRLVDGRNATSIIAGSGAQPALETAKDRSVDRNVDTAGGEPEVTATLGQLGTNNVFTAVSGSAVPTAVRVEAETTVDYFFDVGSGSATRSAIAGRDRQACYKMGSFALGLTSSNSTMLRQLLNDAIDLNVLSYDGLVSSTLTFDQIKSVLNVGTVNEVANTSLTVRQFAALLATALQAKGDTANLVLLQNIAANAKALPPIKIGDVVHMAPTGTSALTTNFNVLDLLAGAILVANGNSALAATLPFQVLNIVSVPMTVSIIQPPVPACGTIGNAPALTSQLTASIPINVTVLGTGVSLTLTVGLARGSGNLTNVLCGQTPASASNPAGIDVAVATGLLDVKLSAALVILTRSINLLSIGPTTPANPNAAPAQIRIPPKGYNEFVETGTGTVGLTGLTFGMPGGLGALVEVVLSPILGILNNTVIPKVDELLLGPLTQLLGLNLAGADVAATSITCGGPALIG